jgi:NitT/TauT family transport system ATP-binding protein
MRFPQDSGGSLTAVQGVSIAVRDREVVSLIGPSGCGKSTLLNIGSGLAAPSEGEAFVDGERVEGPNAHVAFMLQKDLLLPWRTVVENVMFGVEIQGVPAAERKRRAESLLENLKLAEFSGHYPHQLSGGMRQRVAIARTLILKPKIILMDEPFGALDPATRLNMQDLLVGLWRDLEATVFFITHSVEEAVYLGDRVYIISPSPGTLLRETELPSPDRPARVMQREESFTKAVFEIRDIIEKLEETAQAERGSAGQ